MFRINSHSVRRVWLSILIGVLTTVPAARAAERCFSETAQCLRQRFESYWTANGGLPVFGLPLTSLADEPSRDTGATYPTQWLERNRFELHPASQVPGAPRVDVLLGRLGDERLRQLGRDWQSFPKADSSAPRFFAQTGHAIAHAPFWRYWSTHGLDLGDPGISERESLALWGYPISEPAMERNAAGDTVLTQWFERARFEDHGAHGVLLGLLGSEILNANDRLPSTRPDLPQLTLEPVAQGLDRPLFVTHAGDGSNRLFVVEQGGTVRSLHDGATFLDIRDRVLAGGERGLLGLAFHPSFGDNGFVYANYTDRRGDTVIARFTATPDRRRVDANSETRILFQDQPAANHNGGMLAFGPDGYLYIGLGDGGGANDTYGNAQSRASLLGKLLRLDVDTGRPYAIPPDNPFRGDPSARPEIWAYGLRNPWRFSFDRVAGDLYIADVGQSRYEWILYQAAASAGGQNYGWPITEGPACVGSSTCDRSGLVAPVAAYSHDQGCAVSGGYVYRGAQIPALIGTYMFGDLCSGRIWTLRQSHGSWQMREQLKTELQISAFGEDQAGEVYVVDIGGGVYRITAR